MSLPDQPNDAPLQFTLVRILIATALVAATIATIRSIGSGSVISPPAIFAVVGFSGAFMVATLRGFWMAAISVAIVFFPSSVAIAIAPWSVPFVLLASLVAICLLVLIQRRAGREL